MPTYEYQCAACGHQTEAFQKMSDAPLTECPACHQPTLTQLISAAGFQLKGSGWYVTDYKEKGKTKSSNASETESKTEKKSDDTASPTSSTQGNSTSE